MFNLGQWEEKAKGLGLEGKVSETSWVSFAVLFFPGLMGGGHVVFPGQRVLGCWDWDISRDTTSVCEL